MRFPPSFHETDDHGVLQSRESASAGSAAHGLRDARRQTSSPIKLDKQAAVPVRPSTAAGCCSASSIPLALQLHNALPLSPVLLMRFNFVENG